jgi:hypothetical protein
MGEYLEIMYVARKSSPPEGQVQHEIVTLEKANDIFCKNIQLLTPRIVL